MAEPNAKPETSTTKELEFEGYKFKVDTDLLDDVDAFSLINKIENDNQITAIVPLMHYLVGKPAFDKLKTYFVEKDAEAHKGEDGYKARMRLNKLGNLYQVIIKDFSPKD
jgi:hypothetical protein